MNINVLFAVFRRNFVSYFANPTGYVFICLFVLFGAIAALWVPAFFSNNLANLDQLSYWFPFIMLIYVPTITMGAWAEERKQGTDELLLTIPASDFDIVLGKYLAAVAIYSVALLFSLICNLIVLMSLGDPDIGLFVGTYIGYWLVGLAMLSVGIVASFLTSNITIGFVLGVLLNMPLVFFAWADAIFGALTRQGILAVKSWSISHQLSDFSHGVLSLASFAYFFMILAVMLYMSMVLIGRRHWFTGEKRATLVGHYVLRMLALTAIAVGAVVLLRHHDVRADVTVEKLSSLAPQTRALITKLQPDRPVRIDAFVSPVVPEAYVPARQNLLNVLRELRALGGEKKLQIHIHDTERFSNEAALAEKRYGIEPREVTTLNHGTLSSDHVFLHVAVNCGLEKTAPVFIDQDTPAEYELVRSICTVSQQKRKKLGVLNTDAQLYGGFNMQSMAASPNWPIIDELEKQYEVVRVDPAKPITDKFDVLLAVQPSSLGPEEMNHFIAAIRSGQPTAIFEDPAPIWCPGVPATSMPRQPPGGMQQMFMRMQPPPKGNINLLWSLLGVSFTNDRVIWQDFNPYPKLTLFDSNPEFVFIGQGSGAADPFASKNPISAGLQQMLFPFPGAIDKLNTSKFDVTKLAETGQRTGTVPFAEILQMSPFGPRGGLNPDRRHSPTAKPYALAAQIQGKMSDEASKADANDGENTEKKPDDKPKETPKEATINVVLVADIDMLSQVFFRLRDQGEIPELGIHLNFDNVTFILNALDSLAGDERFLEIRKRRPTYRSLRHIEQWTAKDRKDAADQIEEFAKNVEAEERKAQAAMEKEIAELKSRKNVDPNQMLIEVLMKQQDLQRRMESKIEQLRQEKNQERTKIETKLMLKIRGVQETAKLLAVLLPPIPPLLVAVAVFFSRRAREREGVAKSRLR